jgi:hypothetical protein
MDLMKKIYPDLKWAIGSAKLSDLVAQNREQIVLTEKDLEGAREILDIKQESLEVQAMARYVLGYGLWPIYLLKDGRVARQCQIPQGGWWAPNDYDTSKWSVVNKINL